MFLQWQIGKYEQRNPILATVELKSEWKKWKIGKQVKYAAVKEMKQLQNRVVFETVSRNDLTEQENKRAMESLILLV